MRGARIFFLNGILLSLVTVVLRAASVAFNAFVSRMIGEEALGLFTLVMSVYTLAVTFATSSVNLAAVRMTSETMARLEKMGADAASMKKALRRDMVGCIKYSLFFGIVGGAAVYIFAPVIGGHILGDVRTVLSLRVFSASLLPISLAAALSGYFTGINKVYKNAVISALEQVVKMAVITMGLMTIAPRGIEYACACVVGGGAVGEGASLVSSLLFYITDRTRTKGKKKAYLPSENALKKTASIAFPVALGSYVRSSLVCAEHIAIPRGLRAYGANSADALSSYGVVHGMVYPLIFFPSSILASFASLLIPELSAAAATDNKRKIVSVTGKVMKSCLVFSFLTSGIFIAFASFFGLSIYDSHEAGKYIAMIAPLIPVMYLDTSVDFMLKGLGQQLYTMGVNIADAFLSLILVLILVPRFGLMGYIAAVYILEIFNCALSLGRLVKITGVRPMTGWIIRPLISVLLACATVRAISLSPVICISVPVRLAMTVTLSAFLMRICGAVKKSDILYVKNVIKRAKS